MKSKALMTLFKITPSRKTNKINTINQPLKTKKHNKNESEGTGEHCLDGYAAMGVLQLV
ncbi:hypothetical protein [Thalassomonas sp. RHCl1]|uniref:hypothetical protein n=1 Tax=Thalassomonas sp. RHCl1 TaxID=2995320 RepID=UPI00248C0E63|nr:hypothetical protein [Thalassomonas sp. RHCl1]